MRHRILGSALLAFSTLVVSNTAFAAPVLQLDIAGGYYDNSTQTIVASSNPFSLFAIATPQGPRATTQGILNETFYVSMAVNPTLPEPGMDLGYFTVNGQRVDVTEDMVYGKPPIEDIAALQGGDSGDLSPHGIYPTYFTEFAFQFAPTARAATYDTQENIQAGGTSSGPTPTAGGGSYFHEFVIDTSALDPRYVIHFDLYNATARRCGRRERELSGNDPACVDNDVQGFAPFSHDAQSPPVPEPATMLLFGTGLAAAAIRRFRRRHVS